MIAVHADLVAASSELGFKAPYLNVPFFLVRAAGFFTVWVLGALLLFRWSRSDECVPWTRC